MTAEATGGSAGGSAGDEAAAVIGALYERIGESAPRPRLAPTRRAVELLGDPQHMFGVIHITGTNGKTSTARMIDSLLRAHGLRTGLLTSPHLHRLNERIVVDGQEISDEALVFNYRDIEPYLAIVDAELLANGEPPLTFFEALTVLAFAAFADAPVDVAVLEVGMGGEWDSTNVANADVAVLTPIGLDHVERLGPTIADIAKTKAGIIKPASRVVSAPQTDEAMTQIVAAAERDEAPVFVLGRDFDLESVTPGVGGQLLQVRGTAASYPEVFLPLVGEHQAMNAALAIAAVEQFLGGGDYPLATEVIEEGIGQATSPGRLEVLATRPSVLVDGAHNPHGAEALARALVQSFAFDRVIAVVGALREKDATGIIEQLDSVVDHFVVTQSHSERALPVADLRDVVARVAGPERVSAYESFDEAMRAAREAAGPSDAVVVTGSLTLVAEAKEWVADHEEGLL